MSKASTTIDKMKQLLKAGYYFSLSEIKEVLGIGEDKASSIKSEILFNFLKRNIVDNFYIIDIKQDIVVNTIGLSAFEVYGYRFIDTLKKDNSPKVWSHYVSLFENEQMTEEPLLQYFPQFAIHAGDLTRVLQEKEEYNEQYRVIKSFAVTNLIPKKIKNEEVRYGVMLDTKIQHGKEQSYHRIIAMLGILLFKRRAATDFNAHNILRLIERVDLPFKQVCGDTLVTHIKPARKLLGFTETALPHHKLDTKEK